MAVAFDSVAIGAPHLPSLVLSVFLRIFRFLFFFFLKKKGAHTAVHTALAVHRVGCIKVSKIKTEQKHMHARTQKSTFLTRR